MRMTLTAARTRQRRQGMSPQDPSLELISRQLALAETYRNDKGFESFYGMASSVEPVALARLRSAA